MPNLSRILMVYNSCTCPWRKILVLVPNLDWLTKWHTTARLSQSDCVKTITSANLGPFCLQWRDDNKQLMGVTRKTWTPLHPILIMPRLCTAPFVKTSKFGDSLLLPAITYLTKMVSLTFVSLKAVWRKCYWIYFTRKTNITNKQMKSYSEGSKVWVSHKIHLPLIL